MGQTFYVAHKQTLHYGAVVAGEPRTEDEINVCKRIGKRLAQLTSIYFDGDKSIHPLAQDNGG